MSNSWMFWSILHCGQAAAFLGDGHTSLVRDDENYNIEHVIQTTNNSEELSAIYEALVIVDQHDTTHTNGPCIRFLLCGTCPHKTCFPPRRSCAPYKTRTAVRIRTEP